MLFLPSVGDDPLCLVPLDTGNLHIIVSAQSTSILPNFLLTRPMNNFLYYDQIYLYSCFLWSRSGLELWGAMLLLDHLEKGQGTKPKYAVTCQSVTTTHRCWLCPAIFFLQHVSLVRSTYIKTKVETFGLLISVSALASSTTWWNLDIRILIKAKSFGP